MVKTEQRQTPSNEQYRSTPVKLAALGAVALVALGVQSIERNRPPEEPAVNGPRKEYVVQQGDTASTILTRAYPDRDWRALMDMIDNQLSEEDRKNHMLHPNQVLTFGPDAEIGDLVNPSEAESSANAG